MSNVKVRLDDVKQIDIVNVPGGITASELKKLHPDAEVISSLTLFVLKNRLNFVRVDDENKKDGYLGGNDGIGIKNEKDLVFCTYNIHGPSPSTLRDIWNENANQKYLKPCLLFTSKRKRTCNARLKDVPDLKKWKAFLDMINKGEWCLGIKPSPKFPNYIVNFCWFIRPGSIVKFLEGGFGQNNEVKADSNRENYGDELDRRSDYGGIK